MHKATDELVTVIIPTHNRADLVARAIQSALDQTYDHFELIVVDDASTDGTQQVVKNSSDPRLRYIRHERNRGAPAARNTGIEMSSGEYIAFLDDDDTWHAAKLELQVHRLKSAPPEVGVVCCHVRGLSPRGSVNRMCEASGDVLQRALEFDLSGCITSSMLVRGAALRGVAPLDESLPGCQDSDLTIALSVDWHFSFVDKVLVFKGESHERISTGEGKNRGRRMVIQKHDHLYRRFPRRVKRRALAKQHYEEGRRSITRSKDCAAGLAALLRSLFLSPAVLLHMLRLHIYHQLRLGPRMSQATSLDDAKTRAGTSSSTSEK